MAWARIYVGVHFPFDMLGALAVALTSAFLSWCLAPLYLAPTYGVTQRIRLCLFSARIRQGWVRA
jgi:undecaprenyl-diphosphatase